ncbi:acyltransferase family protein [Colwellia sp. 12G3]|uniref:acyltransferase family protein n=1 Tax=Colwellia sp. 12G3 TaxID=2058299 RepID=UPI000C3470BD|nr:acyltransferase [Colwellia sp. 12G3]PKI17202.1 hypothetical protein CXF71_05290 [Colwellia sp. 12G3]
MSILAKVNLGEYVPKTTLYKNNQYLSALTALRGIAALWVVLFHMDVIIFYRELGTIIPHKWSGLITQGYLWVDFFFILSGFIICHIYGEKLSGKLQINNIKKYLISRFFRLYPLHLFTLMLLIGFVVTVSALAPSLIDESWNVYFDWSALISNIFFTNAMNQHTYLSWNIVSWSIGAEWWAYIYGIGLLYFIGNKSEKHSLAIALTSMFFLLLLVYFYPKNNLDITFDFGFLRCLFEFSIGVASYKAFKLKLASRVFQTDGCFVLVLIALFAIFHWRWNDLLTIPLFSILVLCAASNQGNVLRLLSIRGLQYLGRISYSIYLMHGVWFMVFWFILPIIKRTWLIESFTLAQVVIYMIIFITVTLVSAKFSYQYVEVPFRYSNNIKNKCKNNPLLVKNEG